MKTRNFTLIELLVVIVIIGILLAMAGGLVSFLGGCQTGGMGPQNSYTIVVKDKYVDTESDGDGGKDSAYMVATDVGIFEVDNGPLLGVWNADEIYGRLEKGCKYKVRTKGIKKANWFIQEYPYIVEITEGPIKEVQVSTVTSKSTKDFDNMTIKEVQEWAKRNGVEISIKPSGSGPVLEK